MSALAVVDEDRLEELVVRIVNGVVERLSGELMQKKAPEGLTAEAVARKLGITVNGLNRRIERGQFPHPAYGTGKGSTRIWLPEQLEQAAKNIRREVL